MAVVTAYPRQQAAQMNTEWIGWSKHCVFHSAGAWSSLSFIAEAVSHTFAPAWPQESHSTSPCTIQLPNLSWTTASTAWLESCLAATQGRPWMTWGDLRLCLRKLRLWEMLCLQSEIACYKACSFPTFCSVPEMLEQLRYSGEECPQGGWGVFRWPWLYQHLFCVIFPEHCARKICCCRYGHIEVVYAFYIYLF